MPTEVLPQCKGSLAGGNFAFEWFLMSLEVAIELPPPWEALWTEGATEATAGTWWCWDLLVPWEKIKVGIEVEAGKFVAAIPYVLKCGLSF